MAQDTGQLLLQTFEIIQSGVTTLVSPNSAGSSSNTTITHGLGYQPLILAFVAFSSTGSRYPMPYLSPILPTTGTIGWQVSYELTNNNIITFFHRDIAQASNVTDYIRYYILKETSGQTRTV